LHLHGGGGGDDPIIAPYGHIWSELGYFGEDEGAIVRAVIVDCAFEKGVCDGVE